MAKSNLFAIKDENQTNAITEVFCLECLDQDCKIETFNADNEPVFEIKKSLVRNISFGYAIKNDFTCEVCNIEPLELLEETEDKQEQKVDRDIMKALNLDAVRIETSSIMPKALLLQESAEIETTEVNAIEHLKLGKKQIALLQSDPDELDTVKFKEYNDLKQLIAVTEEKLAAKAKDKEVNSLQAQITSDLSGRRSIAKEIAIQANVTEKPIFVGGVMGVKIINNNKAQRRSAASLFDL